MDEVVPLAIEMKAIGFHPGQPVRLLIPRTRSYTCTRTRTLFLLCCMMCIGCA